MPYKSKQQGAGQSTAVAAAADPETDEVFWNNLEAAEQLLQKMFPNQVWEFKVSVPGPGSRPGGMRVVSLTYGLEGETLS